MYCVAVFSGSRRLLDIIVLFLFFLFLFLLLFFLMIRRPPRSTLDRSSAASDVYKRQASGGTPDGNAVHRLQDVGRTEGTANGEVIRYFGCCGQRTVSYTHLRAHETVLDIVCRLLLEKKQQ